jgi:hypothetical protein
MIIMPVDPRITLATSVHSSPGVYALLLGSGISRTAGVPTGWEVVRRLLERLAVLEGVEPDDVFEWYRERGGEPDYSQLLQELAPQPGDRQSLLQPFFEPDDEERQRGEKEPTAAHLSIARLVAAGWIKVIVTTNFDRLLERALAEVGVSPVVIVDAASAAGAAPLAHTPCTVIKVHGDYLNPNIRNTVSELEVYEEDVDGLLDRVLDEYGLVVCGWSGEWDLALRKAILRAPNRRYSTFWAHVGDPSERAVGLIEHRGAVLVPTGGADELFNDLESKVLALESMSRTPLSTDLAVVEMKRYIPNPNERIRLHDLVMNEVIALDHLWQLPMTDADRTFEPVADRMQEIETDCDRLLALTGVLAYFADRDDHDDLIVEVVRRLVYRSRQTAGIEPLVKLQMYPALLVLYVAGVAAIAAERTAPLERALGLSFREWSTEISVPAGLNTWSVLATEACGLALERLDRNRTKLPQSSYLHERLRDPLRLVIPDGARYGQCFDQLELVLGTACAAVRGRGPVGQAAWTQDDGSRRRMIERHRALLLSVTPGDEDLDEIVRGYLEDVDRVW